jgi:hypothetical protein
MKVLYRYGRHHHPAPNHLPTHAPTTQADPKMDLSVMIVYLIIIRNTAHITAIQRVGGRVTLMMSDSSSQCACTSTCCGQPRPSEPRCLKTMSVHFLQRQPHPVSTVVSVHPPSCQSTHHHPTSLPTLTILSGHGMHRCRLSWAQTTLFWRRFMTFSTWMRRSTVRRSLKSEFSWGACLFLPAVSSSSLLSLFEQTGPTRPHFYAVLNAIHPSPARGAAFVRL